MDSRAAPSPGPAMASFNDGFGERWVIAAAGGRVREVLLLTPELSARQEVELAICERAGHLVHLRHQGLARVVAAERKDGDPSLRVMFERAPGIRLVALLAGSAEREVPLAFKGALSLIRQLLAAVSALHDQLPSGGHGAIGPERIVVDSDGRLTLVDQVLGGALERLHFSRERYWREMRVALPLTAGPARFDVRSDITQVGVVALALFLGRPIQSEEYPSQLPTLLDAASARSGDGTTKPLPRNVREWLTRTLQLEAGTSYTTIREVDAGLEEAAGDADRATEARALELFLARCAAPASPPVVPQTMAGLQAASVATVPTTPAKHAAVLRAPSSTAGGSHEALPAPDPAGREEPSSTVVGTSSSRFWLAAVAVILIAVTLGATLFRTGAPAPKATGEMGTLMVGSNPDGVAVHIDGKDGGVTPLTVSLTPGPHLIELLTGTESRRATVEITAGAEVSQFMELTKVASGVGDLNVRTDPAGAKVTVDGRTVGATPITIKRLSAGVHQVRLQHEAGTVTRQVTIRAGEAAALAVPMATQPDSPGSGWIAVSTPADVQVYERGRLLGSSRGDRIVMSVGRHDLQLVNDALGYRATQSVQVKAGQVAAVRPEWPTGTVALNALPWAEVFIAGARVGETPIGSVSLPVGTHDIVFRHPELGERRAAATVTVGAVAKVSVDLRK